MSIKLDIYKGTIRKDILLTLSSQIVIMCSALVVNKILSETMGVEGYGQYSIIKKSSAVLSFMMLGGMGITLPKFLSSYLAENDISRYLFTIKVAIKSVLVITLILLIIYILGQKYLIDSVIGDTNVFLYYIAFFYAFSVCISTLLFSYYRGSDLFVLFSLSQIINQLLLVGCVFLFENSVGTVFLSWAVCTTLFIIYSVFREKQKKIFQFVANGLANHGHCRLILTYSVPRLLGDILLFLFAAFPIIYIGNKLGIKYSGYFAVGVMFITIVSPLFSFLGTVLLPYVSRAIVKKEFVIANKIINKLLLLYIILSIIIVIILSIFMNYWIALFFTQDFIPASDITRILIYSILPESLYLLLRNPIDAVSHFPYNMVNLGICFILLLILFGLSTSLSDYAFSYFVVVSFRGCIAFIMWYINRSRLLKKISYV